MSSQKIGRYEVIRKLGEGGMAEVHLARDPLVDRQVAVKLVAREFTADPEFRARFRREAKIIAKLEHPHIVPIYDFGEHDADASGGAGGQLFIVMRYMPGGSLANRLRKGSLTLVETARLLAPLASALDEAHGQGIIHRDLKPANVLFDARGQPYISDFGIAKLAEGTVSFTGTAMIGTPVYMSPEQWRGDKAIDGRTDIYSLGGMVFEMLTGRMPYEAETPPQLMYKHLNEPPPRILDANPSLPPECNAIIARAMAKDRDERYATAREMAEDVTRLASGQMGKLTRPAAPFAPSPAGELRATFPPTPVPQDLAGLRDLRDLAPPNATPTPPYARTQRPPFRSWMPAIIIGVILCALLALGGSGFAAFQFLNRATATNALSFVTDTPAVTPSSAQTSIPPTVTPPHTQTATPDTRSTMVSDKDGMTLMYVPAGDFLMGSADSDSNAGSDEKPQHTVYLDAYWIDRTEVTNAMFTKFVDATGYETDAEKAGWSDVYTAGSGWNQTNGADWSHPRGPSSNISGIENHPVVHVSWNDASAYCEWAGRRLPTEAEWEKAARGTDGRIYPWGNTSPDSTRLNFNLNVGDTTEVGSYPSGASPYGALDMAGNVWEWVNDWYGESYYGSSPAENPPGPSSGDYRGLRGGSWINVALFVRAADRGWSSPVYRIYFIGCRCSR